MQASVRDPPRFGPTRACSSEMRHAWCRGAGRPRWSEYRGRAGFGHTRSDRAPCFSVGKTASNMTRSIDWRHTTAKSAQVRAWQTRIGVRERPSGAFDLDLQSRKHAESIGPPVEHRGRPREHRGSRPRVRQAGARRPATFRAHESARRNWWEDRPVGLPSAPNKSGVSGCRPGPSFAGLATIEPGSRDRPEDRSPVRFWRFAPAPSGKTKCSRRAPRATTALSTNCAQNVATLSPRFPPLWTGCGEATDRPSRRARRA